MRPAIGGGRPADLIFRLKALGTTYLVPHCFVLLCYEPRKYHQRKALDAEPCVTDVQRPRTPGQSVKMIVSQGKVGKLVLIWNQPITCNVIIMEIGSLQPQRTLNYLFDDEVLETQN